MRHRLTRAIRSRGAAVALLAIGATCGLGAVELAAAPAASAAGCTGTSGVTVVVQSAAGTSTRCAAGDPASAWAALEATGHAVTPVQRFPGAICRIDGYPSSDACVVMPPGNAYWAFFTAPAGGSWSYSSAGARAYNPVPGTAVGFRFGGGSAPSVAPPAKTSAPPPQPTAAPVKPPVRTNAPTPRPSSSRSSSSASAPPAATAPSPRRSTITTSPTTAATSGAATSTTPSASSSATAGTATGTATGTAAPTVAAAPAGARASAASRWPTAIGAILIAALAAAGWFVARRRARH